MYVFYCSLLRHNFQHTHTHTIKSGTKKKEKGLNDKFTNFEQLVD